jgi:hypothetical protein
MESPGVMSDKTTVALSRKPDRASYLYLGTCLVYTVVTIAVGGFRFPSFTVVVLFLTGGALAWTLDVLFRYAADTRRVADAMETQMADTRRIAEAAIEQRNLTHRPCVVAWGLEIEYGGLSGVRFVSRYKLDELVVRGFSTAEVKL